MTSTLERLREELRRLRWLHDHQESIRCPEIPDEARPEVSQLRRRLERLPSGPSNRPESKP